MGRLTKAKWFLSGSLIVLAILLAAVVLVPQGLINTVRWLSGNSGSPHQKGVDGIEVLVETVGVSKTDFQPVVILKEKDGDKRLPIWIGLLEANAISVVLEQVEVPRPLTPDLLCSAIQKFGANVAYITIYELRDHTFYASLVLDADHSQIEIDARPSDAIAVALRTSAPIYVNRAVMEKAGIAQEAKPEKSA